MATRTSESGTFTAEERAAMKERAGELRTSGRTKGAAKTAAELEACLDAIAAMPDDDRRLAERVHEIVTK